MPPNHQDPVSGCTIFEELRAVMRLFENIIFAFVLFLCLWSCGHGSVVRPILDRAEMSLDSHPDSAFVALDSLDRRMLDTPELRARHALLYSQALERCGIEVYDDSIIHIALEYYSSVGDSDNVLKARACLERININASFLSPSDTLKIQNARIIEERYSDKMTLVEKDERLRKIVLLSLLALAALALVIHFIVRKLRSKPDDKTMELIRERLAVLDKIIASRISSDEKLFRSSEEELDVMMADREEFLLSTKILFEESHPGFTAYLKDKGLTDWEIGYCCLYTLGLKGKDIGQYIEKKRHYIISHEIRQKLNLGEHDTNIGIFLRNLLLRTETHM